MKCGNQTFFDKPNFRQILRNLSLPTLDKVGCSSSFKYRTENRIKKNGRLPQEVAGNIFGKYRDN